MTDHYMRALYEARLRLWLAELYLACLPGGGGPEGATAGPEPVVGPSDHS
jgi:hypothetical protein